LVIFIELSATTLFVAGAADAQGTNRSANYTGTIDAGTEIAVRTNETIDTKQANGRVFSGNVAEDVRDTAGNIAIPKGADVELVVKRTIDNDLALDLDAVNINGRRYGVETEENAINSGKKEGIGANKRTGKYVGGGAIIGAIIGGIAGGGKGAAIGAGAGAAAGAGAQVLTKGDRVEVPAESLVTFRLEEPMRTPVLDRGFSRDGVHYHQGYGNSVSASRAFNEGLRAGRADADRNLARNPQTNRWNTDAQRSDYRAGYNQGYDEVRRNR
jgi:hypothetical protein